MGLKKDKSNQLSVNKENAKKSVSHNNYHNWGLDLLRVLMCFEVVLCHFWSSETYSRILMPFSELRTCAVPVFMLMSFFLAGKSFFEINGAYIKKRIWRLFWPLVAWAVIYWGIFGMIEMISGTNMVEGLGDLFWQIVTGHSPRLNASMWYQMVLIMLSLFFYFLCWKCNKIKSIVILNCLLPISLILQYSGINYRLFSNLRYELCYPLGRITEMMPYAVIGLDIVYFGIFEKIKPFKKWILIGCPVIGIIAVVLVKKGIMSNPVGFGYSGIVLVMIAIAIFTFAYLIPLEILPETLKKFISIVSRYTLGIYCIHRLVGYFLVTELMEAGVVVGSFKMCILLYAICYVISAIISNFPLKLCKQLVQ